MSKTMVNGDGNTETVVLRGASIALKSDLGVAFVCDCSRNWERILSNNAICEKYGLSAEDWQGMGANKALVAAVRIEPQRRIKNSTAAVELAAKEFATAPAELGKILRNPNSNARHVIEAHRELRATAVGAGPEGTSNAAEHFTITINLGSDSEKLVIDAGKIAPRPPDKDWEISDGMAD
jgi:hypothetical protein